MKKVALSVVIGLFFSITLFSQISTYSFGEGLNVIGKDSSFSINAGFRFQTLFDNNWVVGADKLNDIGQLKSNILIRRARLKAAGFAFSQTLKYKFELGLSNRDMNHEGVAYFGRGSNIVYDAFMVWNFYRGFSVQAGQAKLPGNRERIISSAEMQFVDRSILNEMFNLDRDVGVMLMHDGSIGRANTKLVAAISQGEGRNVIAGYFDGYEYTFRAELLPFGNFIDKGDYSGSDLVREEKPKLAIAATFDYNQNTVRTRNNLGAFMVGNNLDYKDVWSGFVDFMFKLKGFSIMGEYAVRYTEDQNAQLYDNNNTVVGIYTTGAALNLQAGYLFKSNYEVAVRYSKFNPQNILIGNPMEEYMIGFSRFVVGHNLKIQTDLAYLKQENSDDSIGWRLQLELCF